MHDTVDSYRPQGLPECQILVLAFLEVGSLVCTAPLVGIRGPHHHMVVLVLILIFYHSIQSRTSLHSACHELTPLWGRGGICVCITIFLLSLLQVLSWDYKVFTKTPPTSAILVYIAGVGEGLDGA